jgi:hypothetical protein
VRRKAKQGMGSDTAAPSVPATPADEPATTGEGVKGADAADAISYSNLSLHELFEQQARSMLENADLDEEQKQSILVAMACPCCGAGGMSFSMKLKR